MPDETTKPGVETGLSNLEIGSRLRLVDPSFMGSREQFSASRRRMVLLVWLDLVRLFAERERSVGDGWSGRLSSAAAHDRRAQSMPGPPRMGSAQADLPHSGPETPARPSPGQTPSAPSGRWPVPGKRCAKCPGRGIADLLLHPDGTPANTGQSAGGLHTLATVQDNQLDPLAGRLQGQNQAPVRIRIASFRSPTRMMPSRSECPMKWSTFAGLSSRASRRSSGLAARYGSRLTRSR